MKQKKHCLPQYYLVVILIVITCIISCRKPDGAGPNDNWCTSGIDISKINDANVPASVKSEIYAAPPGFTAVGSPDYNDNLPLVIIPLEYNDSLPHNTTVTTAVIREIFFSERTGSIRDYFTENSWGQFKITEGWIANPVTLSGNPSDYNWTTIAEKLCQGSNVNWAAIDDNNDGTISRNEAQICFMFSAGGGGAHRPANISFASQNRVYNIPGNFVYFDCKPNGDPTIGMDALKYNFSTICHELIHGMFGVLDRYIGGICGTGRVGQYDIMSDNCGWKHMTIYDKMKIGWIHPPILVKPSQRSDGKRHCYTFPNSETSPAALILWDANQPEEYWIVENRHKASTRYNFDRDLPESGLAIWWVNEYENTLSLVDARDLSIRPQNIRYIGGDQRGALFRNRTGTRDSTFNMQFLRSGTNSTEMAIRAPSPEGPTMYAEF